MIRHQQIPDRQQILLYNGRNEKRKTSYKTLTLKEHPGKRLQQRLAAQHGHVKIHMQKVNASNYCSSRISNLIDDEYTQLTV
ncbi:hypothetical protein GOBAR_DD29143 [Gossypium barbadense]|nr:hypothetical protein GOBAR_DD29143 [Gossypium barbadense]